MTTPIPPFLQARQTATASTIKAKFNTWVRTLLPTHAGEGATIRHLRAVSNAAIARHDATGAVAVLSQDAIVLTSGDTRIVGQMAMAQAFERAFDDPDFITYVRSPNRVVIQSENNVAAEFGLWTAIRRDHSRGGFYLARWKKSAHGWRIRSELYIPLV